MSKCVPLNKEVSVQMIKEIMLRDNWSGTGIKKQIDVRRCVAQRT